MSRLLLFLFCFFSLSALTQKNIPPEIAAKQKAIKAEITLNQKRIDSLKNRLKVIRDSMVVYPVWELGGGAISGFDFNQFSNWANRGDNNNSSASSINISVNGFVNRKGKNNFWKNSTRINLGWQRFRQTETEEDTKFEKIADMVQLSSLYGYNVSPKVAISALSEWESNLIDQAISPSYIDFSTGITWTPNKKFNCTIHPLNYELALSEQDLFESSFGAKLLFEYSNWIDKKIRLQSGFTGFLSYEDVDFLSNFTWRNSVNLKLIKSIGIGAEYAMRINKQETAAITTSDEHLQSYLVIGLSFEIP